MKPTLIPWLVALLPCAAMASPQDTATAASKPSDEVQQRLADLDQEMNDFVNQWRKEQAETRKKQAEEIEKAKAEGRPLPGMMSIAMAPDYGPFATRLLGWADESEGDDAAWYLAQAVQLGGFEKDGLVALRRLVSNHAASPAVATIGRQLGYAPQALGAERAARIFAALEKSPNANVRGWIAHARYAAVIEEATRDSEEYATARAAIVAAAAEVTDKALHGELQGAIDLREKLGVGATAPDIAGIDLDGVDFKLSDYKGKVIFLDFWGDW